MSIIFRKLKSEEFPEALQLRIRVFVCEQKVPLSEEQDQYDAFAEHFGVFKAGRLIGTGRLVVEGQRGLIGRIAICKEFRGRGLGSGLIKTILQAGAAAGISEFSLGAQLQALPFYERLGFRPEGEVYPDGGIPHRLMRFVP